MKTTKPSPTAKRPRKLLLELSGDDVEPRDGAPLHDTIRCAAYFNYLNEGRPEGRELQHWLDAESRLNGTTHRT